MSTSNFFKRKSEFSPKINTKPEILGQATTQNFECTIMLGQTYTCVVHGMQVEPMLVAWECCLRDCDNSEKFKFADFIFSENESFHFWTWKMMRKVMRCVWCVSMCFDAMCLMCLDVFRCVLMTVFQCVLLGVWCVWCFLMCLMRDFDGSRAQCVWCGLMFNVFDVFWCVLSLMFVVCDARVRCVLMCFDVFWCVLMYFDVFDLFWCVLMWLLCLRCDVPEFIESQLAFHFYLVFQFQVDVWGTEKYSKTEI